MGHSNKIQSTRYFKKKIRSLKNDLGKYYSRNIGTFVKTKSGFRVTNPEGFVAIDRMEGGAVKLVDRLEFSANNFSKDIIKGWDNPN